MKTLWVQIVIVASYVAFLGGIFWLYWKYIKKMTPST